MTTEEGGALDAYIDESALKKLEGQAAAAAAAASRKECLSLLLGEARTWRGKPYAVVTGLADGGNDATAVSVKFEEGAFPALAQQLNDAVDRGELVVGWAHSHPSYGCFLSPTDVRTQKAYFNRPFSVALVIDPLRGEKQFFKLSDDGNEYRDATYAVYRRRQAPAAPHAPERV